MKISKLEIVGFKSFPEKSAISFPPGISAIVGPNGCGKSNVIDAMRWVMGEQSVKTLRGKNMEDIIFAGANGKPPLNMAEVTLTIANDNGHAPEEFRDYSEISVTRRLFRSGESAYLINRQPCRLKDIYNLFMGSGVGSRTFAIIQQGNIGAIIDAGPDERRLFLEEAAGVTRYKFRKNEALRKVQATEQNLLRLNDIIAEVNRQMAGLHRQAKKAERYKQYQERLKSVDIHLLLHYFDDYTQQIQNTEQLLKRLKDTDLAHTTQLRAIDAAVEEIKLKRWQKNQEIATQKNDHHETQRAIDRAETERTHARADIERLTAEIVALEQASHTLNAKTATIRSEVEQIETANSRFNGEADQIKKTIEGRRSQTEALQQRISLLNHQMEEQKKSLIHLVAEEARLKNVFHNASTNRENLKRRLKRIDEEVALAAKKVAGATQGRDEAQTALDGIKRQIVEHDTRIGVLKDELNARAGELGAQVKQSQTLELERNKTRSQLTTLKKMAANFEWYRDGVKAVMRARAPIVTPDAGGTVDTAAAPLTGIVGLMDDIVEPERDYETAVEAALGEALQFILVENQAAAGAAIDFLRSGGTGRCGFLPLDSLKPLCAGVEPAAAPGRQRLLDHVHIKPGYEKITQALLGHVAVADTLDDALALFNRNGCIQSVVTRGGEIISHQGSMMGGSQEQMSGILAKKQELKSLTESAARLEGEAIEAQRRQHALEHAVRDLETQLQQCISQKNSAAEEALEAEKNLYRFSQDLTNAKRHQEIVELEQEQLIGEESDIDEEMAKYNQALSRISAEVEASQNQSSSGAQELGRVSEQLAAHNQTVVDLKLQLTSVNAKLENGLQTMQRLKEFERDSRQRLHQLGTDIQQKKEKLCLNQSRLSGAEGSLQQLYDTLRGLEQVLSTNESEYTAIDAALNEHDQRLAAIQSEREQTLEKIRVVELDLSEKRILRDNVSGRAVERYHCPLAALRARQAEAEEAPRMSVEEMEKELDRFRGKMAEIGDVNLSAISEYETLKQRFDFLTAQRDDLVKAIEDLHKVIRKINRITQERFMETFAAVNAKLGEVFPKLFEGGSARLELTDPDKPLETGVEYMVHPPGKKLTRMSLLSGGEKALSAIAFIFAIFLIRPASFCLLDEIDAPLDEANVVRFNNLMQVIGQKSQIVMITHNKKSMEFAEMLFGVTMEAKGVSKVVSVNLQGRQN